MRISVCTSSVNDHGKELVSHGSAAFPIACYMDDLSASSVPWHWHEELEFALVAEGVLSISVGGSNITVEKGSGIFINTEILHSMQNGEDSPCLLHSIVFHGRLVGGSIDSIFWQKYLRPLLNSAALPFALLNQNIKWQKEALLLAERTWQDRAGEASGYEFSVRSTLSRILCLLFSHCSLTETKEPTKKALRENERIKLMLQYIHGHFSEELTVPQIAQSALISDSECLRCFKNTIGTSPIRYVKQYRLQRAAELLNSSTATVTDVAAKCGFQEMSYFARAFREFYHMSPSDYRKRHMLSKSPLMPSSSNISL